MRSLFWQLHHLCADQAVCSAWLMLLQCKQGQKGIDRVSYGPYLYALSPDVLAVLTMHGEWLVKPLLCHSHNTGTGDNHAAQSCTGGATSCPLRE